MAEQQAGALRASQNNLDPTLVLADTVLAAISVYPPLAFPDDCQGEGAIKELPKNRCAAWCVVDRTQAASAGKEAVAYSGLPAVMP